MIKNSYRRSIIFLAFVFYFFFSCTPQDETTTKPILAPTSSYGNVTAASASEWIQPPKLILFIVIDQFRADYLTRVAPCLLPARRTDGHIGGFRYLMKHGAYYPWMQHDVLQAMTGPGHATLVTGAYPRRNGIPLNSWFDQEAAKPVYCTADDMYYTIGSSPTGPEVGTSPRNLIGTTIGDSLKMSGIPSKTVSISLKDRAAILLGGHNAEAVVWFDKKAFHWVSSNFYAGANQFPEWIQLLNTAIDKRRGTTFEWEPINQGCGTFGGNEKAFAKTVTIGEPQSLKSPLGLDMTLDAAQAALKTFSLGGGEGTDILFVSFSTHDQVGHDAGPNSRAIEDLTLRLDQTLSSLFESVNASVPGGINNVLIVLTGDHGVSPESDYLIHNRIESKRLNDIIIRDRLEAELTKVFKAPVGGPWVLHAEDFNYYLNRHAAEQKKLLFETVEEMAKTILQQEEGVLFAFTSQDVAANRLPAGPFKKQILHSYFPGRSGDVVAVLRPFFMDDDYATTHITGYAYDTHVPLLIAGPHVRAGIYAQRAEAIDVAPTIAFLTGIIPPPLSEGRVLDEIIRPQIERRKGSP